MSPKTLACALNPPFVTFVLTPLMVLLKDFWKSRSSVKSIAKKKPFQMKNSTPAPMPGPADLTREVSLNEEESMSVRVTEDASGNIILDCATGEVFGPTSALLGTLNTDGTGNPLLWNDAITENPALGSTEEWVIYNFTADAHPIHIHQVHFEVVNRQEGLDGFGAIRGPEVWETGYKDTVISYPGEITRVKALYDIPGFYVWHCHIVEHEDNEMMRPFHVGPIPPDAPAQGFSIQPFKKK